jgi:hypothetical protein
MSASRLSARGHTGICTGNRRPGVNRGITAKERTPPERTETLLTGFSIWQCIYTPYAVKPSQAAEKRQGEGRFPLSLCPVRCFGVSLSGQCFLHLFSAMVNSTKVQQSSTKIQLSVKNVTKQKETKNAIL